MLERYETDLKIVDKALEESLANHNVLIGQRQTILHYIQIEKDKAKVADVEKVADTVESTVEAVAE